MKLSELHFDLPPEQIAQEPCQRRDASRMLKLDRQTGTFSDHQFFEIANFLRPGDVLVLNNTRVFPARLLGHREGFTGRVEVFLVREQGPNLWLSLVKPGRRIPVGTKLTFADGRLRGEVVERTPDGRRIIQFQSDEPFHTVVDAIGQTPLPPYIHRYASGDVRLDRDTYQTVYARERGAIAAPTAGLHFTPELLQQLRDKGVETVELTLHVGYGTFQPIQTETIEEHHLEGEYFAIPEATADRVNAAKREGRRVIAVGTTSTRTLETAATVTDDGVEIGAGNGMSELMIYPGYEFKILDGLITNFHLPNSSLLALVCAFGGYETVMSAYRHAVENKYRFFSYGDCMLLV